uniref:Uncharacterized protein n=1 Tax=Glossina austeni TaxID=7395 RepID=A0A1A9UGG5_GLOAU
MKIRKFCDIFDYVLCSSAKVECHRVWKYRLQRTFLYASFKIGIICLLYNLRSVATFLLCYFTAVAITTNTIRIKTYDNRNHGSGGSVVIHSTNTDGFITFYCIH